MINARNLNLFISILPTLSDEGGAGDAAFRRVFQNRFTTQLTSRQLIERNSVLGKICDGARKWFRVDAAASERLDEMFRELVQGCPRERVDALPPEAQRAFYRLKHEAPQEIEGNGPLGSLQAELRRIAPEEDVPEQLHWSQDPDRLRELSLLPAHPMPDHDDDAAVLPLLSNSSTEGQTANHLVQLWGWMRQMPLLSQDDRIDQWSEALNEAIHNKKIVEIIAARGLRCPSERPEALIDLRQHAVQMANSIRDLAVGQKKLILGRVMARMPKIEIPSFEFLQNSFGRVNLFISQTCNALIAGVQQAAERNVQQRLYNVLQDGFLETLVPSLFSSLFEDRSAIGKVIIAPVELLRWLAAAEVRTLYREAAGDISEQFKAWLGGEAPYQELLEALRRGDGHELLRTKLDAFLRQTVHSLRKQLLTSLVSLVRQNTPTQLCHLLQTLGYGDFGADEQQVWLEIEKLDHQRVNVCVYACGSAAQLQQPAPHNASLFPVVVQYRDLPLSAVDRGFCLAFFEVEVYPQWHGGKPRVADLYHGLFQSFGVEPADLRGDPRYFGEDAANAGSGLFGALYAWLHVQTDAVARGGFQFQLRKTLFLNAAKRVYHDPARLRTWQNEGNLLVQAALDLYRRRLLPLDELKAMYATAADIAHKTAIVPQSCHRAQTLPPQLAYHLKQLFSHVSESSAEMLREMLAAAGGERILEAVDLVLSESPPAPPRVERPLHRSLLDLTLRVTLGLTPADFTRRVRSKSIIRLTMLIVRIAGIILFPKAILAHITIAATLALSQCVYWYFSDQIRWIQRLKGRLLGHLFGKYLPRSWMPQHFIAALEEWSAMAARTAIARYRVTARARNERGEFELPLNERAARNIAQNLIQPPRAAAIPIQLICSASDLYAQLDHWISIAVSAGDVSICSSHVLRSLPAPQDAFWEELPESQLRPVLNLVGRLGISLQEKSGKITILPIRFELSLALFKLYAIADKLARRCPETRLEGFSANGWPLANWDLQAGFILPNALWRQELQQLQQYFGVDPHVHGRLPQAQLERLWENCLFAQMSGDPWEAPATKRYLRQFLQDPRIVQRLADCNVLPSDPEQEIFAVLLSNPEIPAWPEASGAAGPRLSLTLNLGNRSGEERIMPEAFQWLLLLHRCAHTYDPFDKTIRMTTGGGLQVLYVHRRSNWAGEMIDGMLGIFGIESRLGHERTILDRFPGARSLQWSLCGTLHGFKPLDACAERFDYGMILARLSQYHSHRTQNQIINNPSRFTRRDFVSFSILPFSLSKLWQSFDFGTYLSSWPVETRAIVEMMYADAEDMPVRVLAFLQQRLDRLQEPIMPKILFIFFLQSRSLNAYLIKHPEFTHTIGRFFAQLMAVLIRAKRFDELYEYWEMAVYARAEANSVHPGLGDLAFEQFDAQVEQFHQTEETSKAKALILLPFLLEQPTRERFSKAAAALALISRSIKPQFIRQWEEVYHAFISRWSVLFQSLLNSRVRDRFLNAGLSNLQGAENLQWVGAFPHYRTSCGRWSYSFGRLPPYIGENRFADKRTTQSILRNEIQRLFNPAFIATLNLSHSNIYEYRLNDFLLARPNVDDSIHLQYTHDGVPYTFTWRDENMSFWLGVRGEQEEVLSVDELGKVLQVRPVINRSVDHRRVTLEYAPLTVVIRGKPCHAVFSSLRDPGLGFLSWFEPPSHIRAFCPIDAPDEVLAIEFTRLKLRFFVENNIAYGEGDLSGLQISANQKAIPSLQYLSRYLLLQNNENQYYALLPSDALSGALGSWVLDRSGIESSMLLENAASSRIDTTAALGPVRSYLYTVDTRGNLISEDPEATLHLLLYHFARRMMSEVHRDLCRLESLAKRKLFSPHCCTLLKSIPAAALIGTPEINAIILRLMAAAAENQLLQDQTNQPSTQQQQKTEAILTWALLQTHYMRYQAEPSRAGIFRLNEWQELQVLQQIRDIGKDFLPQILKSAPEIEEFSIARSLLEQSSEWLSMTQTVADRYYALQIKYAHPNDRRELQKQAASRMLLTSLMPSADSRPASGQSRSIFDQQLWRMLEDLMSNNVHVPRFITYLKADAKCLDLVDEVELEAVHIDPPDLLTNFLAYYQIAVQQIFTDQPMRPQQEEILRQKHGRLLRSLHLLQARRSVLPKDIKVVLSILIAAATHPGQFPSPRYCWDFDHEDIISLMSTAYKRTRVLSWVASLPWKDMALDGLRSSVEQLASVPQRFISWVQAGARLGERLGQLGASGAVAIRDDDILLAPDLAQEMQRRDREMQGICSAILDASCTRREIDQAPPEMVPFDAASNDRLMERYFGRLNHSMAAFRARPVAFTQFQLRSDELFYSLGAALKRAKLELEAHVLQAQNSILTLSNKPRPIEAADAESIPRLIGEMRTNPTALDNTSRFQLVLQAFGKQDRDWFHTHTTLTPDQMALLEQQLYYFLIAATRLHQLERASRIWSQIDGNRNPEESDILLQQLGLELTRPRAYDIIQDRAKWVRSCLLFEYGTRVMLWEKQALQIQTMLQTPHERMILELITGSGKTFFGIPMIGYYGDPQQRTLHHFFPDSLAQRCTDLTSRTSDEVFGQPTTSFAINRSRPLEEPHLKAMLFAYLRAQQRGEQFSGSKQDIQALELRFIEMLDNTCGRESSESSRFRAFVNLLAHIRLRVRANIDEAHHLLRRDQELNYPLGMRKSIPENLVIPMLHCIKTLVANPEIAQQIGLQREDIAQIDEEYYHASIKPLMATEMSRFAPWNIAPAHRQELMDYLCGRTPNIPPFIREHPARSEIGLVAGLLNKILPHALACKIFVDYGPSQCGNGEYARPYAGNNTPIETANIKNPYEAIVKTAIMILHIKLRPQQLESLSAKLIELAKQEQIRSAATLEHTQIARLFNRWTDGHVSFLEFTQNPRRYQQQLDASPEAQLFYVCKCIVPNITYFTRNLRSNSYNFASTFQAFYGDTATPNADGAFPIHTRVLWDEGTTGEFVDFICQTSQDRPDAIVEIASENPIASLNEILNTLFMPGSRSSAIIDSGALFRGLSNSQAAEHILQFISTNRPDLRGVVFFNEQQKLVVWEKGTDEPVAFEQSHLQPHERISYYDQTHTVGADIKQPIRAVGVVTLSNSSLEQLVQAGGRMRGLKTAQQRLTIVLTRAAKQQICGPRPISMRDIIAFAEKNEAADQGMNNYLAARAMIYDITRRTVLDQILFVNNTERAHNLFTTFRDVFIDRSEEDPFILYGQPDVLISPQQLLQQIKHQQLNLLRREGLIPAAAINAAEQQMNQIGIEPIYPEHIQTPLLQTQPLGFELGASQQVHQIEVQSIEVQQQVQVQVQQQVHQQIDERPALPPLRTDSAQWNPEQPYFRDPRLMPWQLYPRDNNRAEIYSVARWLARIDPTLPALFGQRMHWTNNFLGRLENGSLSQEIAPLRKPIFQLLLVRSLSTKGQPLIRSIAIDQAEAHFWRTRFELSRNNKLKAPSHIQFALFDLSLQAVVDTGHNRLTEEQLFSDPDFRKDILRWKLIAGQPNFSTSNLERTAAMRSTFEQWLESQDIEAVRSCQAFFACNGSASYKNSDMEHFLSVVSDHEVFLPSR